MSGTTTAYALITKVMDVKHELIVRDWLSFVDIKPKQLVVYMPVNAAIQAVVDAMCADFGVEQTPVLARPGEDLKNEETAILHRLMAAAQTEYVMLVNLDTLPFREGAGEASWLQEVFERFRAEPELQFFSGCGLIFEGDTVEPSGRFRRTQRFSNNFGLLRKADWTRAMRDYPVSKIDDAGAYRYHSEWALEEMYRRENLWGIRRVETRNWRVFHVQQWGPRLFETREHFRRGVGVDKYLNRSHEATLGQWDYYYNALKPPLVQRARVWIGKKRRELWSQLTGKH